MLKSFHQDNYLYNSNIKGYISNNNNINNDESELKTKRNFNNNAYNKSYLPDIVENKVNSKKIELDNSIEDNTKEKIIKYNNYNIANNYNNINKANIKLPLIVLNNNNNNSKLLLENLKKSGSNNFPINDFRYIKHNLSNQSIENINNYNNITQYSKNMVKNKIAFKKDQFKELKKNYISPYAQKVMNNNLKIS